MQFTRFETAQAAVEKIAQEFLAYSQQNRPVHISLSGGSTPKLLFKTLAQSPFAEQIQWQNLHFWWGDDRMVAPTDPESNYGEVQKLLFDHIQIPAENIHRIRGENEVNAELARFTQELDLVPNHQFDWIILGMGNDGHTASLFPHQTDFNDENLAVIAKHPETGQLRISKTAKLLENAKRITYLVTGAAKAEILQEIQSTPAENLPYPAAKIKAKNGVTEWYLDQDAAGLLSVSMKKATLTQHAIGQGGFYTGILELENGDKFSYVYDCGSVTKAPKKGKKRLEQEIDDFIQKTKGKIDVIFISHLDEDHINGLKYLLNHQGRNNSHYTNIILPYLNQVNALYSLSTEATRYREYILSDLSLQLYFPLDNNLKLPFDSVSLNYVVASKEEYDEIDEKEIKVDIDNPLDRFRLSFSGNTKITDNANFLYIEEKIALKLNKIWDFIPYVNQVSSKNINSFKQAFKSMFGGITKNIIEDVLKDKQKTAQLKSLYANHIGIKDHNNVSLCIYSISNDFPINYSINYGVKLSNGKTGWLYTGDIDLSMNNRTNKNIEFVTYYKNTIISNHNVFCIPHHGSKYNFNKTSIKNLNLNLSDVYTVSVGRRNRYRHPHVDIINLMSNYNFYTINETSHNLELILDF